MDGMGYAYMLCHQLSWINFEHIMIFFLHQFTTLVFLTHVILSTNKEEHW